MHRSSSCMSSTESICASVVFLSIRREAIPHLYRSRLTAISSSIHAIISWEFICNLGFESSLLRSRRQWRWTAAVSRPLLPPSITSRFPLLTADAASFPSSSQQLYIACRFFTISQVATDLVGLNLTNQFNCKARLSHAPYLPSLSCLGSPHPRSHRSG